MMHLLLTVAVVASTAFTIFLLSLPSRYVRHSPPKGTTSDSANEPKISVQVLVLGDIGRSPRMQYHAMSIAKHGGRVDIIGYKESALHPGLVNNPLVKIVALPYRHLFSGRNPPSIPTLFIALIICFLRNTHLIIDWHNYGWTILAGTRGPSHPFVTLSKLYEAILGRWAPTSSFTVTDAMARQLRNKPYNIRSPIFTLHDRPAAIFRPLSNAQARRAFLECTPETKEYAKDIMAGTTRLLVSSTSWTPDEDFNLLLEALCSYSACTTKKPLPPILAIITGKGPQKQTYLDLIASLTRSSKLKNVTISTAWLSAQDYATLLACADLGVCLHKSSSGVDLPMKVVDMFGAGLPVVGYADYESWGELVKEGVNGRGFVTCEDLASVLEALFQDKERKELDKLRMGAVKEGRRGWDEEWDSVAGRLLGFLD